MARGYRSWDVDQQLLLPADMRQWLPADHEVWGLLEAVDQFDLSRFLPPKRADGKGRAGYHPAMLVALLLYAYCTGERSSRRVERLCEENVAFRVLTGDQQPDHATIARFRAGHDEALKQLHVQVLALCAEAGMVNVGLVAVDATKVAADASGRANRTYERIVAQVEEMHDQAVAVDAAEDARYGQARGDELPEPLRDPGRRRERFTAAKERIEADTARDHAAWRKRMDRRAELARQGKKPPGQPIKQAAVEPVAQGRRANTTDPDSRVLKRPGGYVQGYSVQAMTSSDQIIIACEVTNEQNDNRWLHPMLDTAQANLAAAAVDTPIAVLLADRGYYSDHNVRAAGPHDPVLLIATTSGAKLDQRITNTAPRRHRSVTMQHMTERLASHQGRQLYSWRQHTIEPVFGDLKHNQRFTRMARRGLPACQAEISLACTAHNLRKWAARRRQRPTTTPG